MNNKSSINEWDDGYEPPNDELCVDLPTPYEMVEKDEYMMFLGEDAKEFIKATIGSDSDLARRVKIVVFDPPYYDPEDYELVNQRSRLKDKRISFNKQYTRIMKPEHREEILSRIRLYLEKAGNDDYFILHHHTRKERIPVLDRGLACEHVWIKPINVTIAGNIDRNNGEYIIVEGNRIAKKIRGRTLNKYITDVAPLMINDPSPRMVRACAKPPELYKLLFNHLGVSEGDVILDPFAGWGGSIRAGLAMQAYVLACDIDTDLIVTWEKHVQDAKQSRLDYYFLEEV